MIDLGLTAQYRSAYEMPHIPVVRVEVWDDREQLAVLPVGGGQVDCSLSSQVTRSGSLTCDAALTPTRTSDLLAPYGNRLRIFRGFRYGGSEWTVPVFTGLIISAKRRRGQACTVRFSDRAYEVDENDFEATEETLRGRTVVEEIVRLIREGVPDAVFGRHDSVAVQAAAQQFSDSRAQACDDLGDAAGAFWYALADGSFVVRRVPWTYHRDGVTVEPVAEYRDYDRTLFGRAGTITDHDRGMSREQLYNIVVGSSDNADGSAPQRYTSRDNDPASPTYIGGKFGRRVLRAEFPSAATALVVRHGTETLQRRSVASAESITFEMVPDPALELGDPIGLHLGSSADDPMRLRVVSDMTIPLTADDKMSVTARPLVLPGGRMIDEIAG